MKLKRKVELTLWADFNNGAQSIEVGTLTMPAWVTLVENRVAVNVVKRPWLWRLVGLKVDEAGLDEALVDQLTGGALSDEEDKKQ